MEQISSKQQTVFFMAIVFLFAFGLALLVYKNYSDYYQQEIATSDEISAIPTASVSPHQSASATTTNLTQ